MKGTRTWLVTSLGFSAVLLLVSTLPVLAAQEGERQTLRGVESFDLFVLLRAGDAGARALGITQEQLQADTEERFRRAHIEFARNSRAHLLLSVSIVSITHPRVDGILAYVTTVELRFRQGAVLEPTGRQATVTTWDETRFGATSPIKNLDRRIRHSVGALVDLFIEDYLAANAVRDTGQRNAPQDNSVMQP